MVTRPPFQGHQQAVRACGPNSWRAGVAVFLAVQFRSSSSHRAVVNEPKRYQKAGVLWASQQSFSAEVKIATLSQRLFGKSDQDWPESGLWQFSSIFGDHSIAIPSSKPSARTWLLVVSVNRRPAGHHGSEVLLRLQAKQVAEVCR